MEIEARTTIPELNLLLPLPIPEDDHYETLGGYLNTLFGKIANEGESIRDDAYEFTVLRRNRRAVEAVRITRIDEQSPDEVIEDAMTTAEVSRDLALAKVLPVE
jgi:CBS domain containing-hemolysin-like protein